MFEKFELSKKLNHLFHISFSSLRLWCLHYFNGTFIHKLVELRVFVVNKIYILWFFFKFIWEDLQNVFLFNLISSKLSRFITMIIMLLILLFRKSTMY